MSERKGKERKPLIQPGSVLGDSPDIIASVLSNYAESTGQPVPVVKQDGADASEEKGEETAATTQTTSANVSKPAGQPADKPAKQRQVAERSNPGAQPPAEDAQARANTPKRLCSYRIPEGLDDWLEEYTFQHRHDGLKKQDLVAQAIALLIVHKAAEKEGGDRQE